MAAATETASMKANAQLNLPEAKKSDIITCDLHNPTRATRIIYDGIPGSMRQFSIGSKETKRVTISRVVAEEFRDRNRTKKDSELVIRQVEEA